MVQKLADAVAESIKELETPEMQVKKAFELIYQRAPTPEELSVSTAFVQKPPLKDASASPLTVEPGAQDRVDSDVTAQVDAAATSRAETDARDKKDDKDVPKRLPDSPLRSFCWALISSNEFLFID